MRKISGRKDHPFVVEHSGEQDAQAENTSYAHRRQKPVRREGKMPTIHWTLL